MRIVRQRLALVIGVIGLGIVGIIGSTGCDASAEPAQTSKDQISALRERMHVQLAAAKAMQLAIALGDLGRAHTEAQGLAAQSDPNWLPEWRPYLADIRSAAKQIAASSDTVTAAKTMAQLGRDCSRCHEANHAKVTFPPEPAPSVNPKLGSQMASHQWAAARMWEGLIGNSNELWLAGAKTLAGARMTITAEKGELGIADDAARAKLLAERAIKIGDHAERATLYGDLLATCAHCHATIRDRQLQQH